MTVYPLPLGLTFSPPLPSEVRLQPYPHPTPAWRAIVSPCTPF